MIERKAFYSGVSVSRASRRALDKAELVFLLITVTVLLLITGLWLRSLMIHDGTVVMATITVQPGETLWGLAEKYGDPHVYILERVDRLAKLNNIQESRMLREGQTLVVPVSSKTEAMQYRGTYASNQISE